MPADRYDRVWRSRTHLTERLGQRLRVVALGTLNSALIEFEDGARHVVSVFGYGRPCLASPHRDG